MKMVVEISNRLLIFKTSYKDQNRFEFFETGFFDKTRF